MLEIFSPKNIFFGVTIIPLIISNILHMMVVKKNYLAFLNLPIHERLFGKNKTYRGFIVVPFINGILYTILNWPGGLLMSSLNPDLNHTLSVRTSILNFDSILLLFLIGTIYGIFYVGFELPNSFIKRRLGIKAGENSQKNHLFFKLIDKTDSAFGLSLFYGYLNDFNFILMIKFFFIAAFLHVVLSVMLVAAKIKKSF